VRGVEILIVALLLAVAVIIPACTQKESKQPAEATQQAGTQPAGTVTTPSGLGYVDVVPGTGSRRLLESRSSALHRWLENGTKFDSSVDRRSRSYSPSDAPAPP